MTRKLIKEFEDYQFFVDESGNITDKSGDEVFCGVDHRGYRRLRRGKYGCPNYVQLCVHVIVAKYFGDWFDGCHVHHKNELVTDNRIENLLCLSKSDHKKLHHRKK